MKRNLSFLVTLLFMFALSVLSPTGSSSVSIYDPWIDTNDDGKINIVDITNVAKAFWTSGVPIDKRELLLELQTARTHNETFSTTLATISGYSAIFNWQDMSDMTVKVTLETSARLLIMFSAQVQVAGTGQEMYVKAMVDSTEANPSTGVTFTKSTGWGACSYTFYSQDSSAGTHTIKIQWKLYDEIGNGQVLARTLVVTSLP